VSTSTVISLPTPMEGMSLPDLESELLGWPGTSPQPNADSCSCWPSSTTATGWAGDGIRSCAHWLTWRAGMSRRTAVEHLRVVHALPNLPPGRFSDSHCDGPVDRECGEPDRNAHPGP
jgi:hypothetical protein